MLGAIIGGAVGLASSIFGGSSAAAEAEAAAARKRRMIAKRKVDNENWYNKNYNEDSTQRADAQRILQLTEDSIRKRNKASAGRAAIVGGPDEQTAREKEANNRAYASAVGQIAAEGQRRKDAIEEKYEARKDALVDADAGIEDNLSNQRIANIRSATQGIAGLAGTIGSAFDK